VTILVWAAAYYPRNETQVAADIAAQRAAITDPAELVEFDSPENLARLEASLHQRNSFLGRAGQWIEPVVRPLGWDWRIGSAAIASFPAREVVMGVLGVIYSLGADVDVGATEDQNRLQDRLRAARWDDTGQPVYNLAVALSIMVFFALCAQCAATLAVIRRETNSWRWPAFTFAYMTALAYVAALVTYQVTIRMI
jgi:ferrous iron transport protein B